MAWPRPDRHPVTRVERFRAARRDPELAVLEGFHALKHALRFDAESLEIVVAQDGPALRLGCELAPDVLERLSCARTLPWHEYAELAPLPHPTGAIGIARRRQATPAEVLGVPGTQPLVLLESPAHLGNLGAAVRVAAAAGAGGVLATGPHDPWHPEALRAAAGLHYALPVAWLESLARGTRPLVAITPEGEDLGSAILPPRAVLAFGTERSGLSEEVLASADHRISIPMMAGVSSLNLATAVAVVLYAWRLRDPEGC